MFYIIMPNGESRNRLIAWLGKNKISSVFHYLPLHKSAMSQNFGWDNTKCPISAEVSEKIIRLPMFFDLKAKEIEYIVDKIIQFKNFN